MLVTILHPPGFPYFGGTQVFPEIDNAIAMFGNGCGAGIVAATGQQGTNNRSAQF